MKIRMWDLETFSFRFKADAGGHVMCGSWVDYGSKKPECLALDNFKRYKSDPLDDGPLVLALREVLEDADIWVTWYGSKFDAPFLNSRLLKHRMAPLPPKPHIDLWRVARDGLCISRNSLANASQFLGLDSKTPLLLEEWVKAVAGNRKSLSYIKEHCDQDVIVLGQAYDVLRPLIKKHPNVTTEVNGVCTTCGNKSLQKRGFRQAEKHRYQVFFCKNCKSWPIGPKIKEVK